MKLSVVISTGPQGREYYDFRVYDYEGGLERVGGVNFETRVVLRLDVPQATKMIARSLYVDGLVVPLSPEELMLYIKLNYKFDVQVLAME